MNLQSLLIIVLALGAGGIVKGATGMGLPMVAMPILVTFLPIPHAIAVVSMPIVITNLWQMMQLRHALDGSRFLVPLIAAGAVGVVIGTWMLTSVPERAMSLVLGILLLAYAAMRVTRPDFVLPRKLGDRLAAPVGLGAGALQGATGLSAPIGVTFIHSMRLPRDAHVAAVSAMFFLMFAAQVPVMWIAGILDGPRLAESLFAVIPALALMPLGARLASRLSARAFDRMVLVLLVVAGIQLIIKAAEG